jgi:hypothetical protein
MCLCIAFISDEQERGRERDDLFEYTLSYTQRARRGSGQDSLREIFLAISFSSNNKSQSEKKDAPPVMREEETTRDFRTSVPSSHNCILTVEAKVLNLNHHRVARALSPLVIIVSKVWTFARKWLARKFLFRFVTSSREGLRSLTHFSRSALCCADSFFRAFVNCLFWNNCVWSSVARKKSEGILQKKVSVVKNKKNRNFIVILLLRHFARW